MRRKVILFVGAIFSFALQGKAQSFWGTTTVPAVTSGKAGIGSTSTTPPTDSWLHIYGQPIWGTCTTGGTFTGGGTSYSVPHFPNPEIWIDRQQIPGAMPPCTLPSTNYFQISNTGSGTTSIIDVFNQNGWLGVLQPIPTKPLDVNGDALIENDLYVNNNANITRNAYVQGQVVIGADIIATSNTPTGYNLYVSKGILTEKLKVANQYDFNWADFVFSSDYHLMSLSKVESFIKVNKHLPEIPSATEVAKNGIDVASMDAKLLQKIEELTLYVIDQQKQIDGLKQQIGIK